jgi:hypothetical protein
VLGVRILPQGPLRSDEADPDPWVPWALADGHSIPFGHGVLFVVVGSVLLLDQVRTELGGWTSPK